MSIKSSKKTIDGLSTVREDTPAKEEEVDVHTEDDEDDIEDDREEIQCDTSPDLKLLRNGLSTSG